MSVTGRISETITVGGVNFNSVISKTNSGQMGAEEAYVAAKTGQLTTRTNATDGVITGATGHGVVTGKLINIQWTGSTPSAGSRRAVQATVAGDAITITGGYGDNLPDNLTNVTLSVCTETAFPVVGANVTMLALMCEGGDVEVSIVTAVPAEITHVHLTNGQAYQWSLDNGFTNPVTGSTIANVITGAIAGAAAGTVRIGCLYTA